MATALLTPPPQHAQQLPDTVRHDLSLDCDHHASLATYERRLSDNELSYFLPSRADGVNDMYLHIGFRVSGADIVTPRRLALAWAILRVRHPLLASRVLVNPGEYDNARFSYAPPRDAEKALNQATDAIFHHGPRAKDDLVSTYLNGPRTLSSERLSSLLVSTEPGDELEVNVMFCAAHFIGDGMALHQTANDFFALLAASADGQQGVRTEEELEAVLDAEWTDRWGSTAAAGGVEPIGGSVAVEGMQPIPASSEQRLPQPQNKFQAAAVKVDFKNNEAKLIGGHTFPRAATKSTRRTVVQTISFDGAATKAALKKCKSEGATISNALFAVCNLAWMRTMERQTRAEELPMMMYSAINLRPYLSPSPSTSFWFLSVGYFNVILPTLRPDAAESAVFWHRARCAKVQGAKYMKSPMLLARTQEMARERGTRARKWAKEDDDALLPVVLPTTPQVPNGGLKLDIAPAMLLTPPPSPRPELGAVPSSPRSPRVFFKRVRTASKTVFNFLTGTIRKSSLAPPATPVLRSSSSPLASPKSTQAPAVELPPSPALSATPTLASIPPPATPKVPFTVLIGLSLLGNLDGTYKHASYAPADEKRGVTLHTLTTGSRQRSGGMLLFGYTFAGKMWVSLGWDVNAFKEGVVERFWEEVGNVVREQLTECK